MAAFHFSGFTANGGFRVHPPSAQGTKRKPIPTRTNDGFGLGLFDVCP
jgi:hypothetical protein